MNEVGVRGLSDHVAAGLTAARARVGAVSALAVLLASLCLSPLLDGSWWLPRTAGAVLVIACAGAAVRVLQLPAPLQPVVQAIVLLETLTLMFAREQALWGFAPGFASIERLRDLAAQGRAFADSSVPPAGPDEGLLLLIVAGIGLVALAVDTLAAGLDLPGLSLVPLAAVFAVSWAIGGGSAPMWAFLCVAVGWLGVLSATQRDRASRWSPEARPGSARGGVLVAAVTMGLAAAAGGLTSLGGPLDPVRLGIGAGNGSGPVELDALVSLRRSLVNNDDRLILTYGTTTSAPDYLRLAVLEEFDGETWRPAGATSLGPQPPPGPSADTAGGSSLLEYRLDVGPLSGSTLPSPSGTIASQNPWPVVFDQRTSLPLRADGESIEGERIGLVVDPLRWDTEQLRAASTQGVAGAAAENLADPEPLVGPELPQLAREVTAGTQTPYDAAVALQRWFTSDGGFTYSTEVASGAGEDALSAFLEQRVGYCEQFSATMALMARSVGIPARVVVGFTQGIREGDVWLVRGTDAHAWPELWLGSAGWVRFEPTPGNATTTRPGYTQPTDDPSAGPSAPEEQPQDGAATDPTDIPRQALAAEEIDVPGGQAPTRPADVLARALGALVLLLLLSPAVVRVLRRMRRWRAGDAESCYREVVDTALDLSLGAEGPTPRSTIGSIRTALETIGPPCDPDLDSALRAVLTAVERHRYAATGDARAHPTRAEDVATLGGPVGVAVLERPASGPASGSAQLRMHTRRIRRALARRAGWPRRIWAAALPRSVVRGLVGGERTDVGR